MKFSLILPVYKVEKYIAKCLTTCCEQDFPHNDYEIIIVDDESPDGSIAIAQSFIDLHPDMAIRIIHRKNGGLSAARNSGLREARGEYIWFIDSDDYIEKKALSVLSQHLNTNCDIISFSHYLCVDERIKNTSSNMEIYNCTGIEYLRNHSFLSAWTALYRKDYLTDSQLWFKEGVIWEDSEFNIRAYSQTKNCLCIPDVLYYYVRRPNSISSEKATWLSTYSHITNAYGLFDFCEAIKMEEEEKSVLYKKAIDSIISAIAGFPELSHKEKQRGRGLIDNNASRIYKTIDKKGTIKQKLILYSYKGNHFIVEKILNFLIHQAIKKSLRNDS